MLCTFILVLVLLIVTVTVISAQPQCAYDCGLNGDCLANGTCSCYPGWKGTTCSILNLEPIDLATNGYHNEQARIWSWGGLPVYDPPTQLWHLFVAEMTQHCDVYTYWKTNSRIIRAVSVNVTGPYKFVAEVRPPFAHNPTVRRMPDGSIVVWMIGGWPTVQHNCSSAESPQSNHSSSLFSLADDPVSPTDNGCGPEPPFNGGCGISYGWSANVSGPFQWDYLHIVDQNHSNLFDCAHTNPAPYVFTNGSIALGFNAGWCHNYMETLGVAQAPHFYGPYTLRTVNSIFNDSHRSEDPFLWVDDKGYYHIIAHNLASGPPSIYAYSKDGVHFIITPDAPYTDKVTLNNGTMIQCDIERPQLLFNDDGSPHVLTNGVYCSALGLTNWTLFRRVLS